MKKTIVISGFPGIGKSYLFKENKGRIVLDSDSSQFSWIAKGVRNPNFPKNYITHIENNLGKADIILVSSHKIVRDALKDNGIPYYLVYPNRELKDAYLKRYKERGNENSFIEMMDTNWDVFLNEIEAETFPKKIQLEEGQFLKDKINALQTLLSVKESVNKTIENTK